MGKINLDETYIFKISIKMRFDATIGIKIPFFRVSVTIEPGHSLLQFVTMNCLILHAPVFKQSFLENLNRKSNFSLKSGDLRRVLPSYM